MKTTVLFISSIILSTFFSYGQCNDDERKLLVLGDSWAFFSWSNNSYNENFNRFGLSDKKAYSTGTLSVNGTQADNFFTASRIQELTDALNDNPTIEYVHFSLGGNDILGTYHVNNTPAQNQQDYHTLMVDIKAGIDLIHNINPNIKILLSGYDYPNFEETIQNFIIPNQHPFYDQWSDMGQPVASQLNAVLIEVTNLFIDSAAVWNNVEFVSNLGLMQNTYGQNSPLTVAPGGTYAAGSLTVPNGLPNYPSPTACLNFGGTDSFHLNNNAYEHFIKRHFQEYYWEAIRNADATLLANDTTLNGTVTANSATSDSLAIGATKGVLTFNTSWLDPTKNIASASIFIKRAGLNGSNLIGEELTLAIKSGHFGANLQLEIDDFNAIPDASANACTYGTVDENNAWMRIDIPANLVQHISSSGFTQFRLHYDNASSNNYFNFYNTNSVNQQAILDIKYDGYVSINENKSNTSTLLYPNPFNTVLHLTAAKAIQQIELFDLSGKLVHSQKSINTQKHTINTATISKGVYSLRITFNDGNYETQKIIK
ncbi:MAG: T9SS type A sorting domain-containing protein [Flavobacteriales bacterium]|jgi:hypothetical protein|nr:T9SS type A sorting domain-containing protein [Flavobacteriales bacterium]